MIPFRMGNHSAPRRMNALLLLGAHTLAHSLQMVSLASSFEGRCFNRLCSPPSLRARSKKGAQFAAARSVLEGWRRVGAGARAHVCEMDLFHSISHGGRGGRADGRTGAGGGNRYARRLVIRLREAATPPPPPLPLSKRHNSNPITD